MTAPSGSSAGSYSHTTPKKTPKVGHNHLTGNANPKVPPQETLPAMGAAGRTHAKSRAHTHPPTAVYLGGGGDSVSNKL